MQSGGSTDWRRRHRRQRRRRLLAAHGLAAALHLLVLALVAALIGGRYDLLPVRFQLEPAIPRLFQADPDRPLSGAEMERLVIEGQPEDLPWTEISMLPPPLALPAPVPDTRLSIPSWEGGKRIRFEAMPDSLPALKAIDLAMLQRRLRELARYRRMRMPDAGTDQTVSRDRQRAREVVMAAVEAMGGLEALSRIREMTLRPASDVPLQRQSDMLRRGVTQSEIADQLEARQSFFKHTGTRSLYAQTLPGGGRVVWDGRAGWVVVEGLAHQVQEDSAWVIQNRAERWDFLSRYVGDGLQLTYLGSQARGEGHGYDVIRVDDFRFGGVSYRALFDRRTRLLVAEEYPADDPALRRRFLAYGNIGGAHLWQQVESSSLLSARRDTLAVSYGPVPDNVFDLGGTDSTLVLKGHEESTATLWVTADIGGSQLIGQPVITAGSLGMVSPLISRVYRQQTQSDTTNLYLTTEQRRKVADQIRRTAVSQLRSRGYFPRVEHLRQESQAQPGDFVLRFRPLRKIAPGERRERGRVFYGAELLDVRSGLRIMADGPIPDHYFGQRYGGMIPPDRTRQSSGGARWAPSSASGVSITGEPLSANESTRKECRFYRMPVYTADAGTAYVSGRKLKELLERTYVKLSMTLRAEREEEWHPYNDDCCYCQQP